MYNKNGLANFYHREIKMDILILQGSPRLQGNTVKMVEAFCEGANNAGHNIQIVNVFEKRIGDCHACEYCHTLGKGECIQKDDMQEIYPLLMNSDMLVIASPIYYHGLSGQLKCAIDRFYSCAYPSKPPKLKKAAIILSSGASNVYEGAIYSFTNDFLGYLGLQNMGIFTAAGTPSEAKLRELKQVGSSLN